MWRAKESHQTDMKSVKIGHRSGTPERNATRALIGSELCARARICAVKLQLQLVSFARPGGLAVLAWLVVAVARPLWLVLCLGSGLSSCLCTSGC